MHYNMNVLEDWANDLIGEGRVADAVKIFLFMADGDKSLDAGYLGERLGQCYESLGDLYAAKYWYGRAVEENPEVCLASVEARKRLQRVTIDEIEPRRDYISKGHAEDLAYLKESIRRDEERLARNEKKS